MIVAATEELSSIFVTEVQEDGTWVLENCTVDVDYWSKLIFHSRDAVLDYHRFYGDIILHDDQATE